MKFSWKKMKLTHLVFQRNVLLGLSACLLVISLLQTIFLFLRSERVVILPPEIKQGFWVEGNKFAPIYIEEQALYMVHLLLDVSEANIMSHGEIVLRAVDSKYYHDFKKRLFEDQERLKKNNLSLHFVVVECEVYPDRLMVDVTGDLNGYVGGKKITTSRETYRIQFSSKSGRLYLASFSSLEKNSTSEMSHLLGD